MATTFTLISAVTVGAGGASSIDFTSIPSTYTDLCIKYSLRSDRATFTNDALYLYPNGSSSSITARQLYGSGSAVASDTEAKVGTITAAGSTANTFSNGEIYIPNYAGSANKSVSADSVGENNATTNYSYLTAFLWSNTAAITSLQLNKIGTNFVQYSTAYLYGVSKS